MKAKLTLLLALVCFTTSSHAQKVMRSSVGMGGSSDRVQVEGKHYFVSQSIGQAGIAGTAISGNFIAR